ncbi:MAG: DUF488 domain-containing protein [Bacteroidales bacterium]|nr:DUF488 domain-containing protein [Bacteroidales bacterium]
MKIYTSYFGNMSRLCGDNILPISVALYPPKWFMGYKFTSLAPTRFMLCGDCSREEYIRMYAKILDKAGAERIVKAVEKVAGSRDVAFLCFEKPGDFCHRHLLADYLNKKLNLGVTEYGVTVKRENEDDSQLSLF